MNVDEYTLDNVEKQGGCKHPPCTGFISDVLPKVKNRKIFKSNNNGVSTRYVHKTTALSTYKSQNYEKHWYALRTTYGREKKAYEFIVSKGFTAFYPTVTTVRLIDGKRKTIEESRLPNIFFAYGTEEEIKSFVYDNIHLPFLRFYYRHFHFGNRVEKEPLIVPDNQIESLRIICQADSDNIIVSSESVEKFQVGQQVRIIEGKFKGVVGTVARYQGQQRVGIVINGLLTIATAYIPNAFIERI